MSTRRKFLALVGMAPVAVPVAAKEAAAAMGLSGPVGIAAMNGGMISSPMGAAIADASWAKRALDNLMSEKGAREVANEARHQSRILDPDIAALRSVSPAFAFRRQRDRNEAQIMNDRKAYFLHEIAENAKRGLLG